MTNAYDARARDNQTKQIQEMVTNVKKHFGQLCQLFAAYTRKTARLRDKADLLVKEVHFYGDTETPNLRKGLKLFADQLAKVQDYRHAQVERLEAKVVEPLKSYGTILRFNRENLKATLSARSREVQQLQQLERMRQKNPSDRQIISQAESNLQRATMNATRTTLQLEEAIDEFEKKKIKDIKTIFTEFITIEMAFHAKALEVYTTAFHHIQDVEEDEDLQVFRSTLRPPDYRNPLELVCTHSRASLDRIHSPRNLQLTSCSNKESDEDTDDDDDDDNSFEDED
ncbi:CBY1-interacting BAR domain-containing protein 1-like [Erpetoichthys calabaricus]|uniref:CBY1-interacting BAR domain-containing protein 1-like n=1 Tax=Erpetoichthys calabaricus TaxID=27687 RepID=UPI0010A02CE4|nr:CBY1-interacting BAR domain-containing protein 1-like [Erpetoichthys calabaricus]